MPDGNWREPNRQLHRIFDECARNTIFEMAFARSPSFFIGVFPADNVPPIERRPAEIIIVRPFGDPDQEWSTVEIATFVRSNVTKQLIAAGYACGEARMASDWRETASWTMGSFTVGSHMRGVRHTFRGTEIPAQIARAQVPRHVEGMLERLGEAGSSCSAIRVLGTDQSTHGPWLGI